MAKHDIRCPYCGTTFGLDEVECSEIWYARWEALQVLGKWGWMLAKEYTLAFRRDPTAKTTPSLRVRVITEIAWLWENLRFKYDKKQYRTTSQFLQEGLRTVCNMQKTGFNDHNYLYKCLIATAQRISAEGLTAAEESKVEDERRGKVAATVAKQQDTMTAQEWMRVQGLRSLTETIKGGAQ